MDVVQALHARRSVRAFLPDPVPRDTVERILMNARRAPSGSNVQPWRIHVLTGAEKDRLCETVVAYRTAHPGEEDWQYNYYPIKWREPFLTRRRKIGWDLYGLLGIQKGDKDRMFEQFNRNFRFFGAPVGLIFTIDEDFELGSWVDYGMLVQSVMLAALAEGLETCAQGAWVAHHRIVREVLALPEQERVVCGMALGLPDPNAPENRLTTERAPLEEFVTFRGFE